MEWDPIKGVILAGEMILFFFWIGAGLSPFGAAAATCTSTVAPTAGNTAACFLKGYNVESVLFLPLLLVMAAVGSITFMAGKFGMIGTEEQR